MIRRCAGVYCVCAAMHTRVCAPHGIGSSAAAALASPSAGGFPSPVGAAAAASFDGGSVGAAADGAAADAAGSASPFSGMHLSSGSGAPVRPRLR